MNRIKRTIISLLTFMVLNTVQGQDVFKLWERLEKPYYKANDLVEYETSAYGTKVVYNVTEPTITIFPAKGKNSGKAILILPGGGYELEAIYHEGYAVAKELASHGITGVVLKYRLPLPASSDRPELVPLIDARRGLKLIREKADNYGINVKNVGIMGFSAGSHLATMTSLWKSDSTHENPDFSVLVYGVTNDKPENIAWLQENLFHRPIDEAEKEKLKFLDLVDSKTPPAFLVHAYDDEVCHVSESTLFAEKLLEHHVPVEMHLFTRGGHGFGLGRQEDGTDQWLPLLVNWLNTDPF
jgi:acetyl esterase/lipase